MLGNYSVKCLMGGKSRKSRGKPGKDVVLVNIFELVVQ